ncbi:hypothetical protein NPS53_09530 [Pseudomonas putida]|uniref:hypothetical protein n=1 Tax=Pseudomonas putida TaxID=303 RepID=UPI002363C726|nr:hypothetical protein [Pseudomonas putida]MDD2139818.1 hypothetical protein [Pseudomonas putida]HDS1721742.1 hypothetical protein [Pseudomonas putida]
MNTLDLKGDLLNLFVALALGGVEGQDVRAPFDEWGCGIVYKGAIFSPVTDIGAVWSEVLRLRISTTDAGEGRWLITSPAPIEGNAAPLPPINCTNPLAGYCYAIVWSAFGSTVPDMLATRLFGVVDLEQFNLDFE